MELRLGLSIDSILRRVYALSALNSYLKSDVQKPALLTRDNRRGLALLAVDAFAELTLRLMPKVADLQLPEDEDDDIMSLTVVATRAERYMNNVGVTLIEECVAYMTLAAVMREVDGELAAGYERKARDAEAGLGAMLDPTGGREARIARF